MSERILALETTETNATVAAWEANRLLVELRPEGRSAQTLAPAIRELLDRLGWKSRDVQCVAVGIGPGSFTGLRVGITTAKMFAYATGAKLIGIDTLEALAAGASNETKRISVAVDAQREEIVARNFQIVDGLPVSLGPQRLISMDQWWSFGREVGEDVIFAGPILRRIEKKVPDGIVLEDRTRWNPLASHIGRLAVKRYEQGQFDDIWTLLPCYSRPSAAEERSPSYALGTPAQSK
ncbi:MAG: tRNA (adenosine(37)-N6)-threonylcarbamoyltransferase complex dimerization subunit type 1 TsaB [Planctomycetaceae bacterium]|nr:tRNA (adenosine(37)-N6)-threonylcarbamoyltransferase complex dimerization subunit type 1 TsaB [Planctomycetaceae bacterium]MCL2305094.1 tRNA (adenosine(37)-N6)-threonylcarbamoyltransferase complex dimerization subunit type 1 TsaB [Planctomycetaceae bacterium]